MRVDSLADGTEVLRKHLERADGNVLFEGNELGEHVDHPDQPQQVHERQAVKEAHALKRRKGFGPDNIKGEAEHKNEDAADQARKVNPSDSGHGQMFSLQLDGAAPP